MYDSARGVVRKACVQISYCFLPMHELNLLLLDKVRLHLAELLVIYNTNVEDHLIQGAADEMMPVSMHFSLVLDDDLVV